MLTFDMHNKDILSGRLARNILVVFSVFIVVAFCTACLGDRRGKLDTIMQPTIVKGIHKNLSGLTWNPETRTLFATTNQPEYLYELSLEGKLLRSIKLIDFEDTEGLTHIQGNIFAIVEERKGVLNILHVPDNATEVARDGHVCVDLGVASSKNKGLEGVSYDPETRTLFTMREGRPFIRFDISLDEQFRPVDVKSVQLPQMKVNDAASLVFSPNGHYWILSEASTQIVELDSDGAVLRSFDLDVDRKKFQPEGITLCLDGVIYITGEPNLLAAYRVVTD